MKSNKILLFCAILVLFGSTISCSDDDSPGIVPEKKHTIFRYAATTDSYVENFNVYVGPKGEKIQGNNDLAKTFWKEGSGLGEAIFDSLIIDTNTDSLYMKTKWSNISMKIKISGDTVKRDQNNNFEFYGRLSDNNSTFILNRAFYFINYKGRENGHGQYPEVGSYGMWRYYEVARFNEFFHENSAFGSLSDMVLVSDTIAYLTEYYKFKLAKSY